MFFGSLACLLPLALALPLTGACLQCDRLVRHLHEDYLLSSSYASVEDQIELKKIIDHIYFLYRETGNRYHGVIDPTTLYRARTEYQSEFHKFMKRPVVDDKLFEAILIMEKGRQILQKHLEVFSQTGLCPNKCGLLLQRVMDCGTCQYEMRTCLSPADQRHCGEFTLEAEEGAQMVLDCFLPWHTLVMGRKDYQYSRHPGLTSCESGDTGGVLVVTPDSSIALNQLRRDEQGVYRCLLLGSNGTVLSCTHYVLTVIPLPLTTPRNIPTLPTLPPGDDRATPAPPRGSERGPLVGVFAAVTALGLAACVAVVVAFGLSLKRRRQEARGQRRGQEVEMTRVSTSSE